MNVNSCYETGKMAISEGLVRLKCVEIKMDEDGG